MMDKLGIPADVQGAIKETTNRMLDEEGAVQSLDVASLPAIDVTHVPV